jgi:post-segregation antitoxin (ccd killing protein)
MTELKVTLPDRLAREAREAGLLTPRAIQRLLREAMRRRAAAREFLSVADRIAAAGLPSMSEGEIQAEIDAVRKARRRGASPRR